MYRIPLKDIKFRIEVLPEPKRVEETDHFQECEPEERQAEEAKIRARVTQGDVWAWCRITVYAEWYDEANDDLYTGDSISLVQASYENEADYLEECYAEHKSEALEAMLWDLPKDISYDFEHDLAE